MKRQRDTKTYDVVDGDGIDALLGVPDGIGPAMDAEIEGDRRERGRKREEERERERELEFALDFILSRQTDPVYEP